jgi:hypothetical protein
VVFNISFFLYCFYPTEKIIWLINYDLNQDFMGCFKLVLLKSAIIIFALLGICMLPAMASEISQFEWIGKNADKVGTWDNGDPDGSMDGHFLIDLFFPDPTEIKSILLYTSDENANPVGGQFWDTAATNYYILGVFDQGIQINHKHVASLEAFSRDIQFDLYAADSGWFEKGNWFAVEVTLGDGKKITRLTSIGEPFENPSGQLGDPKVDGKSKIESILQGDLKSSGSEDQSPSQTDSGTVIFDTWNTGAVDNNPTCSPFFVISQPHMITYIDTYHWNGGQGAAFGGTISLQNGNGETFGPWSVEAKPASGVDNAWWIAHPNVVIPEGNYMIIDSQPKTWSMNSESPCGFAKVEGYAAQADPVPEDNKEGQSESKGTVRADIVVDGECDNLIEILTSGCDAGLPDIPVELTFTYIPPAYSDATPVTLREMTDENGIVYFKDVPAGSKFMLKTRVKTMEKKQEGMMPDPADDVYFTFDYRCKGSWPEEVRKAAEQNSGVDSEGRISGIVNPVCGNEGVICSPECGLYPL